MISYLSLQLLLTEVVVSSSISELDCDFDRFKLPLLS